MSLLHLESWVSVGLTVTHTHTQRQHHSLLDPCYLSRYHSIEASELVKSSRQVRCRDEQQDQSFHTPVPVPESFGPAFPSLGPSQIASSMCTCMVQNTLSFGCFQKLMTSLFSSGITEGRDTIMVSRDFCYLMTLCPMFVALCACPFSPPMPVSFR